ncbi:MAG: hypothetical protein ABI718_08440 [Acidobacteriota bacterium]
MKILLLFAALVILTCSLLAAQTGPPSPELRALITEGHSLLSAGKLPEAIAKFQAALAIEQRPMPMYGLAAAYSRSGRLDASLEWARKAIEAGFMPVGRILTDPDFAAVRADGRFQTIRALVEDRQHPCLKPPEHHQFDFWLGQWSVTARTNPNNPPARSSITLAQEGCAIREEYSTPAGYAGTSLNFYDSATRSWYQTWVDNTGGVLFLRGGLQEGKMVMQSDAAVKPLNRITWSSLPDHQVQQVWETSADGGKTWTVIFDGLYKPVTGSPMS